MDNKMDGLSMDVEQSEKDKLQSIFPQCFNDGKLDIDKLLNLCGEYIDEDFEKYKFEWKGKAECHRIVGKRSTGTLRPCVEESVNFDMTKNLYIEGDNLEVLKLLQTTYFRKVKMIYIDPPYNTGNDFVYNDNFTDPIAHYKEIVGMATKSNPETMGRFHTAWLNMMWPRLRLAHNLLRDDGVCFISIDDGEVHNLRKICDEIFGEENFVAQISNTSNPKGRSDDKFVATAHEYLLVYAKSTNSLDWYGFEPTEEITKRYNKIEVNGKLYREIDLRKTGDQDLRKDRPNMFYYFYYNEVTKDFYPTYDEEVKSGYVRIEPLRDDGQQGRWRWGIDTAKEKLHTLAPKFMPARKIWGVMEKDFLENRSLIKPTSSWTFKDVNSERGSENFIDLGFDKRIFSNPKPLGTIKRCLKLSTTNEDIILDFFSGSATTAHAVMQLNADDGGGRKFIMVQLPEVTDEKSEAYKAGYKNICEIGKERIRRAGAKILTEQAEKQNQMELGGQAEAQPLDVGFKVLKLDTSNLIAWDSTPIKDDNQQTLWDRIERMSLTDTIKKDRSDLDIVYEIMLKMGVHLDYVVSEITVGKRKCYSIGEKAYESHEDCTLLVCLDKWITPEDISAFCEQAPAKIIAAEEAFKDDTSLSNAHYILQDRDIEMKLL